MGNEIDSCQPAFIAGSKYTMIQIPAKNMQVKNPGSSGNDNIFPYNRRYN